MSELHPLTEAECYARCYGESRAGYVRVIQGERTPVGQAGDALCQALEDRLDARAAEAA